MSIADQLITRGWTQKAYQDADGSVCLSRAAALANGDDVEVCTNAQWRAIAQAIREQGFASSLAMSLIPWNDRPERTYDEVLRVAKRADEILVGPQEESDTEGDATWQGQL